MMGAADRSLLAGQIAPRYPCLRVFRMAWRGGLHHTTKNTIGIFRRAKGGGTTEPVPRA